MKGIRYISANDHSGYGTAARRLLHGLRNSAIPFIWTPLAAGGWGLGYEEFRGKSSGDPILDAHLGRDLPYDTVFLHFVPEYALFWREKEPDKRLILHTAWETDRIPRHWRFLLELADIVVVPSTWNRDVFLDSGLRVPVETLPHIALPPSVAHGPLPIAIPDDDFVFLAVDTWTERKGLREMIQCYLDTFTADDRVNLVIKTDRRSGIAAWPLFSSTLRETRSLMRRHRKPARVSLITRSITNHEMLRLHDRADCYISLSHGEGWGIGAFDAATRGKPVISTGFGGVMDYLSPEKAFLVRSRPVPVRNDLGKPSFTHDQLWAEPDTVHAGELMRHVLDHRQEASSRGLLLQADILQRFNEKSIVGRFLDIIDPQKSFPRNWEGTSA